ncbi:MAG: tautomerase family protein [Deltaproteobacteria bacterium HGW-Deltaproteobacteria-10]|nr:MAG: tautomerase family protein [Deltaproteobacteria bacterium HGW-Deltaproteobacteria-10]
MPIVKIEMPAGKPAQYKKSVLDGVHQALVDAFKIPDHDRNQRIYELSPADREMPPDKTTDHIIIEITAFQGRSIVAKRNLYKNIVEELAGRVGVKVDDVTIVLHEVPMENWGVRGGKPASEVDIGFKVKV